jgi:predicted permease
MPNTELLLRVFGIVFPVFVVVLTGWIYGRRHQPEMDAANRMNMEVFIPALVFGALAGGTFEIREQGIPALAMAGMVFGSGLISWPVARALGLAPRTWVPPMMFNNSGNLGIPLALLAFGPQSLPVAVILFLTSNLIHFSLGAYVLNPQQNLWKLWQVPVVMASLLGLGVSLTHVALWPPLLTAIRLLGDISVPMMLFALGVKIASSPLSYARLGLAAGLFRPVIGIACMLLAIQVFQIRGEIAGILIIFGSLPPAVLNYMFAERYQQEPEKVASMVLTGNLLAVVIMPLVLAWVLSTHA